MKKNARESRGEDKKGKNESENKTEIKEDGRKEVEKSNKRISK